MACHRSNLHGMRGRATSAACATEAPGLLGIWRAWQTFHKQLRGRDIELISRTLSAPSRKAGARLVSQSPAPRVAEAHLPMIFETYTVSTKSPS